MPPPQRQARRTLWAEFDSVSPYSSPLLQAFLMIYSEVQTLIQNEDCYKLRLFHALHVPYLYNYDLV